MPDQDKQRLRLGILGAAGIAPKNCRGIKRNTKGVVVVAVASRSLEKAEKFIKDNDLESAKAYSSYDDLLANPDIDAVYAPLPAGLHVKWLCKAAAAKKHILSEKPVALTAADMDAILDACSKHNVQFMDGTMWLHNPRTAYIAEILKNENLMGRLQTVVCHFHFAGDEDFLKNDVRTFKELDGLGCYGDIGWYCVSHILWAYSYEPPEIVQANAGPQFNERGVVMAGGGTLVWKDGRRAQLDCGFMRNLVQHVQIGGLKGSLEWDDLCIPNREDVAIFQQRGAGDFDLLNGRVAQQVESKKVYTDRPQETYMFETFAECIYDIQAGKAPNTHWAKVSAMTNKVVIALQESADNDCKPVHFQA